MKIHLLFSLLCICLIGKAQPNIVLIESDDQSNVAVGAYGFSNIKTPNIDKLADEGVYFTNAYNMGCWSPAVCIPSRTMLFNGEHIWEASRTRPDNVPGPNLTERLNSAGYTTYFTGKWHALGKGPKDIFHHYGHILPGQLKTYRSKEGHMTDIVGQEAVGFIKQAAEKDEPFFLYAAFNAPHVPRQTAQKYYDMYPPNEIIIPPSIKDGPLHPHVKYQYAPNPMKVSTMRRRYQQNNAMVTHMDDRIGEILTALKTSGKYDNTIVIFMSDQGISFGENGVAGKVCLYDVSVKAPLIITGPGIEKGQKFHHRVYLQDIYPTLLDLLGLEQPSYMDYRSLAKIVKGKSKKGPYESIYLAMFSDQRSIIKDDYKLIMYPDARAAELYYLIDDPWEMNNLLLTKNMNKKLQSLGSEFLKWQLEVGDTLDISDIYPRIFN